MLYQPIIGYTAVSLYYTLLDDLDKLQLMSEELTHHHLMATMQLKLDDIVVVDDIVNNDYFAWPEIPEYEFEGTSFNTAYGYESLEKLYNKLVRSQRADYNIEASEGLYK